MHFQSHVSATSVHELLFIDDCALNATSEVYMQRSMYLFAVTCDNFGLVTNTEETVVMHQPPSDTAYAASPINVNGAQLGDLDGVQEAGTETQPLPLRLSSTDWVPDADILEPTEILSIYATLRQLHPRWIGHLVPIDDEQLPKRLFFGDVATGPRRQGGQARRYKDTLKTSLRRLQIDSAN
ncbi:hypothetical protein SprV_0100199600 [Sparganum proliferum]